MTFLLRKTEVAKNLSCSEIKIGQIRAPHEQVKYESVIKLCDSAITVPPFLTVRNSGAETNFIPEMSSKKRKCPRL